MILNNNVASGATVFHGIHPDMSDILNPVPRRGFLYRAIPWEISSPHRGHQSSQFSHQDQAGESWTYMGTQTLPRLTAEFGLGLLGKTLDQARHAYRWFMAQPAYAPENRLLEDTHPEDSRIIGTDRFVASLRIPPLRPRSSITLEQLADSICEHHGIAIDDLTSPRRHSTLMLARRELAQRAIDG